MRACRDLHRAAIACVTLAIALPSSGNAWTVDVSVNMPVTTAPGHQVGVAAASDDAGGLLVAWEDLRSGDRDVYAQRLGVTGGRLWALDGVPLCTRSGPQSDVHVVSDGAGGAIVLWTDLRNASHTDLFAQRVDATGQVLWAADGLAVVDEAGAQLSASMMPDGAGGAFIAWTDHRDPTGANIIGADIYMQRLAADGTAILASGGVAVTTAPGAQAAPRIAPDGAGGAILAWQDLRTAAAVGNAIYAQRVGADGTALWAPEGVPVVSGLTDPRSHTLAAGAGGGAIIAWQDVRDAGVSDTDVYAQSLDAAGTPQWATDGVPVVTRIRPQLRPRAIADGTGGAIIAWDDYRDGSGYPDLYAQRLDGAGTPLWTADGASVCFAPERQVFASIAPDGTGGMLVAWHDYRPGTHADIYTARIDASGAPSWTLAGVATSTAGDTQLFAALAPDGTGGALVAWQDFRADVFDVYAQRIGPDGTPGGATVAIGESGLTPPAGILAAHPNPSAAGASVRLALEHAAHVMLLVVDARGALVRTLIDGALPAGAHERSWDARDDAGARVASGVYFVRLTSDGASTTKPLVVVR